MKQLLTICAMACFLISSTGCVKDDKDHPTSITGNWELRKTTAAMMPTPTIFPPGNGNLLKFTTSKYEIYENNTLRKSGNYSVVKDPTVEESVCLAFAPHRYPERIDYDGQSNDPKEFFELSHDTLTIISGCYAYDAGHTRSYVKTNAK